ncbi:Lateral signaling target protein 2-like protein [Trichoplax sp. H2]|nr:Lateral signaling target protein 2-like protein [Trichoplax sp. H2]|eukprot:RDD40529.1 Lateral signaling target protein 2-like protein [Trichoplax sp. H2]
MTAVMEEAIPMNLRHPRHYRLKFPEDFLTDNLGGMIWFGIEGISAGSAVLNHEEESQEMKPLAAELHKQLNTVRDRLKNQSLRNINIYPKKVINELIELDRLWSEFELRYVNLLTELKSPTSVEDGQLLAVMFSEAIDRALKSDLITSAELECFDPTVFFAVPRLAILYCISGCHEEEFENDFNSDMTIPLMFNSFREELQEIKLLLREVGDEDLSQLEIDLSNQNNKVVKTAAKEASVNNDSIGMASQASVSNSDGDDIKYTALKVVQVQGNSDILHELFVKISSIADRLHHIHAEDIRSALQKSIKVNLLSKPSHSDGDMNQSVAEEKNELSTPLEVLTTNENSSSSNDGDKMHRTVNEVQHERPQELQNDLIQPPSWVPDSRCDACTFCEATFTVLRRKHHCRNCGKIFCKNCVSASKKIPRLGFNRPVKVCQECFNNE